MDDRSAGFFASIALMVISSGVTGRYGDIDGVWAEPVHGAGNE
jgi:hypothetical protein